MKLSVFTPVVNHMTLENALAYLSSLGVDAVELGAGGYPGDAHLNTKQIVENPKTAETIKDLLKKYNMEISAISCHGNPLHPNKDIAMSFHLAFQNAVLVAELLDVHTIIAFSGCPGDSENSRYPNWVTCAWPEDFLHIVNWQWEEKVIPYWKDMSVFASNHGISKIAFEMHPGFVVYNPETCLKLRDAVGDIVGANFDPSHMFWQGIDPVEAIRYMKGAIYHFHAKDTRIDRRNCAINGVLDYKHYSDIENRSWVFRTVGYGNSKSLWNDMISMLKTIGYDGAISIEHEDGLMSSTEGLEKAILFLKNVLIYDQPDSMWWA